MPRKPDHADKDCPLCGRPAHPDEAPFCSRGCKSRDLLKWLGDGYRIAGPPADERDIAGVDSESGDG